MTTRFLVFLSVILSIWLAEHLYVGWRLLSLPIFSSIPTRRAVVIVMAFGFFAYIAARVLAHHGAFAIAAIFEYTGGIWMGAVFLLLAAFVAADIITLGGFVLRPWLGHIRTGAAACALFGVLLAWWGGMARPVVVEVDVETDRLTADQGAIRILQISDLHLSAVSGAGRLRTLIEITEDLQPDVVVITGDLIDGSITALQPQLPMLQRITAPMGVYAVLGNHEMYAGAAPSTDLFEQAGYAVLNNTAVEIVPGVVIAGVPDARGARQTAGPRADLRRALEDVDPDAFIVLMQHAPGSENEAARAGVDLMLNGHTHGGQIWPFHLMVRCDYSHIAGVRRIAGMTQVVSRGAGVWGAPLRLFAPADVVLVTIRTESAPA